jgi:hypothetical protein
MTSISFTSGELLDVISALCDKEQELYYDGEEQLASYYLKIIQQFETIVERMEQLPGEDRVAQLVMAMT